MLKKILAIVAMLYAFAAFAAVDVNKATAAELDGLKGIGPAISSRIIDERKKGAYKDWNDFIVRVKGVGEGNAAKFSAEGLTVNGSGYKGVAAAPAGKKEEKAAAREEKKDAKADAKPAAPAVAVKEEKKDAKADAKAEAKAKKEAENKAKADEKAKKAEEAKAKKDAKAGAAKPAASAASAAKK